MFLYTISCMQAGHTTLTLIFIVFYMTAALLQVGLRRHRGGGAARQGWEGRPSLGRQMLFASFCGTG